jgi:hypothetical protein
MRKVAAVSLVVTLGVLGASATVSASVPTAAQLSWARSKAVAYWHAQPPCGRERVLLIPLPLTTSGQADPGTCSIEINTHLNLRGYPLELCAIYVHEYGHLILGYNYFAASNPSDPAHSSDPDNIMYGAGDETPLQQERQDIGAGCLKPHRGNTY